MNKLFNPSISVERLAAYLDGNLPVHELEEVRSLIATDIDLQGILEDNAQIDETFNEYSGMELEPEISPMFELPQIESFGFDVPDLDTSSILDGLEDLAISEDPLTGFELGNSFHQNDPMSWLNEQNNDIFSNDDDIFHNDSTSLDIDDHNNVDDMFNDL